MELQQLLSELVFFGVNEQSHDPIELMWTDFILSNDCPKIVYEPTFMEYPGGLLVFTFPPQLHDVADMIDILQFGNYSHAAEKFKASFDIHVCLVDFLGQELLVQLILHGSLIQIRLWVYIIMDKLIDADLLEIISPVDAFPPSEEDLLEQLEQGFILQAERFLAVERPFYKCSKAVEQKVRGMLKESQAIANTFVHQKDSLDKLSHDLQVLQQGKVALQKKERLLGVLCNLVKMESMRANLRLEKQRGEQPIQHGLINEEEYLRHFQKLHDMLKEAEVFAQLGKDYQLLKDVLAQLRSMRHQALQKIYKLFFTPRMVQLILTTYFRVFPFDQQFQDILVSNRLQYMRVTLNPMLNNLNYSHNLAELFQHIFYRWIYHLRQEIELFTPSNQIKIVGQTLNFMLREVTPKMEKSLFKSGDLLELVRIRKSLHFFITELKNINWGSHTRVQFDHPTSMAKKCVEIIEAKLAEESRMLQKAKYNIYSLSSYVPIRSHLEKMKICAGYSIDNEPLDWSQPFFVLTASREVKKHSDNKNLLIFNLNIWYLYLNIMKTSSHVQKGELMMQQCIEDFVSLNLKEVAKNYDGGFQKMLELCGNVGLFKNMLMSDVNLLGHEELRERVQQILRRRFIETYKQMLINIQKEAMTNQEVKDYCQAGKINFNKFGKYSNSICIYSHSAFFELL